jgi:hypothetical protein
LKASADLALRRVQLDLGVEELRGGRRISFENLLKAVEVDGRETALRIQPPEAKALLDDLDFSPSTSRRSIPG